MVTFNYNTPARAEEIAETLSVPSTDVTVTRTSTGFVVDIANKVSLTAGEQTALDAVVANWDAGAQRK